METETVAPGRLSIDMRKVAEALEVPHHHHVSADDST